MKPTFVPFLFIAGCVAGCFGELDGDEVAASGLDGSSGGDAATTGSGGSSGGDAATPGSGGSTRDLSLVPTNHRSEAIACPEERGPGTGNVVGECTQDSECTDGMNGRCISPNVLGPLGRSACSYDACLSDSDCPADEPCRCRALAESNSPNYCQVGSNCQVDADCGPGGFCSPSLLGIDSTIYASAISGAGMSVFGYFCHTPQDLCVNDGDCDSSACVAEQGCGSMACGYSSENRWDCFRIGHH